MYKLWSLKCSYTAVVSAKRSFFLKWYVPNGRVVDFNSKNINGPMLCWQPHFAFVWKRTTVWPPCVVMAQRSSSLSQVQKIVGSNRGVNIVIYCSYSCAQLNTQCYCVCLNKIKTLHNQKIKRWHKHVCLSQSEQMFFVKKSPKT
jgi:hypothetical protein